MVECKCSDIDVPSRELTVVHHDSGAMVCIVQFVKSLCTDACAEGIAKGGRSPELDWQLCRAIAISELVCAAFICVLQLLMRNRTACEMMPLRYEPTYFSSLIK